MANFCELPSNIIRTDALEVLIFQLLAPFVGSETGRVFSAPVSAETSVNCPVKLRRVTGFFAGQAVRGERLCLLCMGASNGCQLRIN